MLGSDTSSLDQGDKGLWKETVRKKKLKIDKLVHRFVIWKNSTERPFPDVAYLIILKLN